MSSRFQNIVEAVTGFDEVIAQRWQDDRRGVFVEVRTGDGRSQVVMIQLVDEEGDKIVHVMSEVGPSRPELFATMLRRNLQLRHCRIALIDDGPRSDFALVFAQPLKEIDPPQFTQIFAEAVFMADALGREISDIDT